MHTRLGRSNAFAQVLYNPFTTGSGALRLNRISTCSIRTCIRTPSKGRPLNIYTVSNSHTLPTSPLSLSSSSSSSPTSAAHINVIIIIEQPIVSTQSVIVVLLLPHQNTQQKRIAYKRIDSRQKKRYICRAAASPHTYRRRQSVGATKLSVTVGHRRVSPLLGWVCCDCCSCSDLRRRLRRRRSSRPSFGHPSRAHQSHRRCHVR